jgi:formylglycine-generating enzyme required for sulfatase activity
VRAILVLLVFVASLPALAQPADEPAPCKDAPAGMQCVPGGWFTRGADDGPDNARPADKVWVDTFYMDTYEVTYGDYQACVKAKKCAKAGPHYQDFNRPRQPVTGVSWYDARQYCEAQGKRLPTEAEWERAARGPNNTLHSWGDEAATCERAVIMDKRGRGCGTPKKGGSPEKGRPLEVGSRPVEAYGLYDMMGNSWEWVADWYSPTYAACGADCQGRNPKGPCGGADKCPKHRQKIVRGGSWYWPASYATAVWRRAHVATNNPFHHFGFRCAASTEQAAALPR